MNTYIFVYLQVHLFTHIDIRIHLRINAHISGIHVLTGVKTNRQKILHIIYMYLSTYTFMNICVFTYVFV
jgi:hypothetical protein